MAGERAITCAELDARSSRVAQALGAVGVGFGDRVAFVEKNGAEFFETVCSLGTFGRGRGPGELAAGRTRDAAHHR
ncbi:acyl-CoA synthetase (AMP-forming)/AMP-acid ligase II [Mycobacterium sp. URHB0021]